MPEVLPLIEIEVSAEVQADVGVGKRPRTSAIYATIEPEMTVNLSEYLNVHGHVIFEPVRDPIEGRMNTFRDQGLYAEELYIGVNAGEASPAMRLQVFTASLSPKDTRSRAPSAFRRNTRCLNSLKARATMRSPLSRYSLDRFSRLIRRC